MSNHTPEPWKGTDIFGGPINVVNGKYGSIILARLSNEDDPEGSNTLSLTKESASQLAGWILGISAADPAKAIADAREKVNAAMEECIMEHMDMTAEKLRSALASLGGVA